VPPLATLFDRSAAPPLPLPAAVAARYGGPLGFPAPTGRPFLFSNFVTTLDGVVSFDLPGRAHAGLISRSNDDDRYVLGLLRACADAVVVGAGTLRVERAGRWTPEGAYPDAAADFAALRRALGKPARPTTVFVTASGRLDLDAAVFASTDPVAILTTKQGARLLEWPAGTVPGPVIDRRVPVLVMDADAPTGRDIVAALAANPEWRTILTEGGPTLLGHFLRDGVLDEMFQTLAPQIAGRSAGERRLALVEGTAFAPEAAPWSRLLSVKRSGDGLLFLRYALGAQDRPSSAS